MSLKAAETSPFFYNFDRERSCGGVAAYGVQTKTKIHPLTSAEPPQQKSSDQVGFADLLDIINPLQHLPVISWAYRKITGDTIKPVSAMIGDTIFGGGIGLLTSAVEGALTDYNSRQDQGDNLAQNPDPPNPIDRLISRIIHPEKTILASRDTPNTPPLQNVATAILHYAAFDREQTAGSIAVYG